LQQSLRCIDAGLNPFRGGQVSLLQGPDVALGQIHVVLKMEEDNIVRDYLKNVHNEQTATM
jgi:hypothetical protein